MTISMSPAEKKAATDSSSLDDDSLKVLEKGDAKKDSSALQLDLGEELIRYRKKWWQIWWARLFHGALHTDLLQDSGGCAAPTARHPRRRGGMYRPCAVHNI